MCNVSLTRMAGLTADVGPACCPPDAACVRLSNPPQTALQEQRETHRPEDCSHADANKASSGKVIQVQQVSPGTNLFVFVFFSLSL